MNPRQWGSGGLPLCLFFGVAEPRLVQRTSPSLYFEKLISWTWWKAGLITSVSTAVLELESESAPLQVSDRDHQHLCF